MQIKRVILLSITTLMLLCLISAPAFSQRQDAPAKPKPVKPQMEVDSSLFPPDPKNIPICSMTLEQAPAIRGFRLGMSVDEVAQRFSVANGSTVSAQVAYWKTHDQRNGSFGVEAFGDWLSSSEAAKGVHILRFSFVDGRLFEIYVDYSNSVKWENISQFVEVISSALKINGKWSMPDDKNALLDCGSFKLVARLSHFDEVDITLIDTAGKQEAARRKEETNTRKQEEEEKQRRAFKP